MKRQHFPLYKSDSNQLDYMLQKDGSKQIQER